jgi:hypothetical protein
MTPMTSKTGEVAPKTAASFRRFDPDCTGFHELALPRSSIPEPSNLEQTQMADKN